MPSTSRRKRMVWLCFALVASPLIAIPLFSGGPEPPKSFHRILDLSPNRSGYYVNTFRGAKPSLGFGQDEPAYNYATYWVDMATSQRIRRGLDADVDAHWRIDDWNGFAIWSNENFLVALVPIEKAIGRGKNRPAGVAYEVRTSQLRRGLSHEVRYWLYDKLGLGGPR